MLKILLYVAAALTAAHGAVHLMGFVAYWPLAAVAELPYTTRLAGGRWDVGGTGMKLFALLWLLAALGFLAAIAGLLAHLTWWQPVMLGAIVLSTALIILDWAPAFRGAVVNAAILIAMLLTALLGRG